MNSEYQKGFYDCGYNAGFTKGRVSLVKDAIVFIAVSVFAFYSARETYQSGVDAGINKAVAMDYAKQLVDYGYAKGKSDALHP